jgi:hypothetical protein
LLDGGSGSGGATLGTGGFGTTSGAGGFGLGGAGGTPSNVDAGACAAFGETFMPACIACLDVSCCDVAAMCFAVPDCFGYASCQQNCPPAATDGGVDGGGSNACLDACAQNYPMAGAAFTALSACLAASCPSCPY